MCAITQSFVDERKIIRYIECQREDYHMPDEKSFSSQSGGEGHVAD